MDNTSLFGEEFHNLGFGEAVERGLLTDYKVMILVTDQNYVDIALANEIKSESNSLNAKDFSRIVGTWNGLSKRKSHSNEVEGKPMRRAVAFTSTIETSKQITETFQQVVDSYAYNSDISTGVTVEIDHVDGTMNNLERNRKLDWLEAETGDDNICRILSNARCLTEGVDVPDLDSVIFFNPRNSVIDVIQAVGRVMRKADEKEYGYIILPITIDKGDDVETELHNNKEYKVVWQVLQALRSHDERFNAMINQMELNLNKPKNVEVIGHTGEPSEVNETNMDYETNNNSEEIAEKFEQEAWAFPDLEELQDAIYGQIVDKVGDKRYWENWSKDVAEIAQRHFDRIKLLLRDSNSEAPKTFQKFLLDLRQNLNDSIQEDEAIEMLSQHLITKPVFEALFAGYDFVQNNPVSRAMESMLSLLEEENLEKETRSLEKFYASVRVRASKIDNLEGKQKVIIELYDKFFGTAFKKTTERLGIVYTPVEIVDFIIHSVNGALKEEFGVTFNDETVEVLDPFTGTGTFIARLLQSGIIEEKNILRKYMNEIHANEIVLLAYYIATINIEETFHSIYNDKYIPFEGIVLTDTFQMSEGNETLDSKMFGDNSERAKRQNEKPIVAIVGNPPYSGGQRSENDNNQNMKYKVLDESIADTYAKHSTANLKNTLYNSYIRAIRWATDRIEDKGVIGFVTSGSFIDGTASDGLRKTLYEEFNSIYIFNLRGNQRTSGEDSRKEGGKVFGGGSRTPIAITLLVKNPQKVGCTLYYKDIGDYLSREDKLEIVSDFNNFFTMKEQMTEIIPDKHYNWINHQNEEFESFISLHDNENKIFEKRFVGVKTNRDAWVTNFSKPSLIANANKLIKNYNIEVKRIVHESSKGKKIEVNEFINMNRKEIDWTTNLKKKLSRFEKVETDDDVILFDYRPFSKRYLYNNQDLIERPSRFMELFPNKSTENYTINIMGRGSTKDFSVLISKNVNCYDLLEKTQHFPLYTFHKEETTNLFSDQDEMKVTDNITEEILQEFRKEYDLVILKEDIFYYIYGILHLPLYKDRFASDLRKDIPRVPLVKDFWGFSNAGRGLADLHLNYEEATPYNAIVTVKNNAVDDLYQVKKMRFGKKDRKNDKSVIIYNSHITLSDIPLEAYDYEINGRPAIEWIMDQYQVKIDKASGIKNDPNEYSEDPRYILDLLKRIITVSIETNKIVSNLPDLEVIE